ncbi:MAG: hypothetical protein AAGH79_03020 [Bacteroidota bacterium]
MQRSNFRSTFISLLNARSYQAPYYRLGQSGRFVVLLAGMILGFSATGQTLLDLSVGTSSQDNFNVQVAVRQQFSDRLQVGLELQAGSPQYRFVGAQVMREGYSYAASVPLAFRLAKEKKIQLYGIGRLGARFQGIIDPDENDMRDSILASTAIIGELGLASGFRVGEKITLQAGLSFPLAYEVSPNALFEYTWTKLHFGGSWNSPRTSVFLHSNVGSALGASGDTYKYIWSLEVGVRYTLGNAQNEPFQFIQTSF